MSAIQGWKLPGISPTYRAFGAVMEERVRQDEKWGEQNWPDGTGSLAYQQAADGFRIIADRHYTDGNLTWTDILREEVYEALGESDPERLREELVQVAAVAVAWVEAIDRREGRA